MHRSVLLHCCRIQKNAALHDDDEDDGDLQISPALSEADLKVAQSSVTCLYQTKLDVPVSVTWFKSALGQGFSVNMHNGPHICKVDLKPWFFWKKKGSQSVHVQGKRLEVIWDLSSACYFNGPEPHQGFHLVLLYDNEIVLLLGDMEDAALNRNMIAGPGSAHPSMAFSLFSRKVHLFGKRVYNTKTQIVDAGSIHDISIECHIKGSKDPWLCVRVDNRMILCVRHLMWKFRGNQTIQIDGAEVELFWDAHNWLFHPSCAYAVFMFHTLAGLDQKQASSSSEKRVSTKLATVLDLPLSNACKRNMDWITSSSCCSLMECSNAQSFRDPNKMSAGFSLIVYAWRTD